MRFFEKLDILNYQDADNGTQNVGIYNEIVSVNKYTNHGNVTIGVSPDR